MWKIFVLWGGHQIIQRIFKMAMGTSYYSTSDKYYAHGACPQQSFPPLHFNGNDTHLDSDSDSGAKLFI